MTLVRVQTDGLLNLQFFYIILLSLIFYVDNFGAFIKTKIPFPEAYRDMCTVTGNLNLTPTNKSSFCNLSLIQD